MFEAGGILRHLTDEEMLTVVTSDSWGMICGAQRALGMARKRRRRS
jgi:hypothetical protein